MAGMIIFGIPPQVHADTVSISLDRDIYPVPFGVPNDFDINSETPDSRSVFPIHSSGLDKNNKLDNGEYISNGDLDIHVRINDPSFDVSSGEDKIAVADEHGPVTISVLRDGETLILATAGAVSADSGVFSANGDSANVPELGPITEISSDPGIFEFDMGIRFTDGPSSSTCPVVSAGLLLERFGPDNANRPDRPCILKGDILQVEYNDPTDASGDNIVTDSATFNLRDGALQTDKLVYVIGSDMVLTLIEPDFDLDNDAVETYELDLIEWDSDAATLSMGDRGGEITTFDPEPTVFLKETGNSTGIFQIVIETPAKLKHDWLERDEEIYLEYTDWGPTGSNYVGASNKNIKTTIRASNFGATIQLDKEIYSWRDKVHITINAKDFNWDPNEIEEIGNISGWPIKISTGEHDINQYKLVETGADTGIFIGEITLTGFEYDVDGDGEYDITSPEHSVNGSGPFDGKLPNDRGGGISVSFEFTEDVKVSKSALIKWTLGEVYWLDNPYPTQGNGIVKIEDSDMNINLEAADNFDVDVWSNSDTEGIVLTVTETGVATGIFNGTVQFTTDESSASTLKVADGNTVALRYLDRTHYTKNHGTYITEAICIADTAKVSCTGQIPPSSRDKHKSIAKWSKANYLINETATISIIEPDMNINPEAADNFDVAIWSDSNNSGFALTVTETNKTSGIFEGTIQFTTGESSGNTLKVALNNSIHVKYEDSTIPTPNFPDRVEIYADACIGADRIYSNSTHNCIDDPANTVTDVAGNNTATTETPVNTNSTDPVPTITTTERSPTNNSIIPYTVTFDTAINATTFTASDIVKSSGTIQAFTNNNNTFTFKVINVTEGHLAVSIPANKVADNAGNSNTASNKITITIDRTSPAPVISTTANKTSLRTVPFTVDFGNEINPGTFNASDITISSGTISALKDSGYGTKFTFNVEKPKNSTTLDVSIPANKVTDKAGNSNTASNKVSVAIEKTKAETNSTSKTEKKESKPETKEKVKPATPKLQPPEPKLQPPKIEPETKPIAPQPANTVPDPKPVEIQPVIVPDPEPAEIQPVNTELIPDPEPVAETDEVKCGRGTVKINGICHVQSANTQNGQGFFDWLISLFGILG